MTFVGMYALTSPACVSMIGSAVSDPPALGLRRILKPSPLDLSSFSACAFPSSPLRTGASPRLSQSSTTLFTTTNSSAILAARSSRREWM